ncbi:hypothetical protein J6590_105739 [Homalodisca vitripennis]|nr:hypothetical protein J6590_105739 [Homalodisca vitripennis]
MYQLLTVTTLLSAALVSGAVPKCDQTITSQLAALHPNGIPQNIIGNLLSNGPYSYVVVSTVETSLFGITTQCIGITMRDSDTAAVIYKFPFPLNVQGSKMPYYTALNGRHGCEVKKSDRKLGIHKKLTGVGRSNKTEETRNKSLAYFDPSSYRKLMEAAFRDNFGQWVFLFLFLRRYDCSDSSVCFYPSKSVRAGELCSTVSTRGTTRGIRPPLSASPMGHLTISAKKHIHSSDSRHFGQLGCSSVTRSPRYPNYTEQWVTMVATQTEVQSIPSQQRGTYLLYHSIYQSLYTRGIDNSGQRNTGWSYQIEEQSGYLGSHSHTMTQCNLVSHLCPCRWVASVEVRSQPCQVRYRPSRSIGGSVTTGGLLSVCVFRYRENGDQFSGYWERTFLSWGKDFFTDPVPGSSPAQLLPYYNSSVALRQYLHPNT